MEYNLDQLSSMRLGNLDLFLDCMLIDAPGKTDSIDIFKGHDTEPKLLIAGLAPSLDDDIFPDWLDLKMDMSLLEGVETPDILDDLLLGEIANGQSVDSLPTLQMEPKSLLPLDLDQLPYGQPAVTIPSTQEISPVVDDSATRVTPPSSPDWLVPDVSGCSPTSFFSPVSEPGSPGYVVISLPPSPAPAEDTLLTFIAPGALSFSVVAAEESISSQSLALDIMSSQLSLESENVCPEIIQKNLAQPNVSSPAPVLKKGRKRKIHLKSLGTSSTKPEVSRPFENSIGDISFLPPPPSKKERKRKQNKDAAMRYRMKKRMETDVLGEEESLLLVQNKKLKNNLQQLSNELGYLKNLMREMFKAKGLLK